MWSGTGRRFSWSLWRDETAVCLPFGRVIRGGHHLALLLRLLGSTGVDKIGSETGVVRPFAFFCGNELCLLLYGRELHLYFAIALLRAGPAPAARACNPPLPL